MGMTIDEAIEKYKNQAEWEHSHNNMDYCEEYEQLAKWLEKLQKIQEIVEHWACCGNPSDSMIAISEVLEDGNDII